MGRDLDQHDPLQDADGNSLTSTDAVYSSTVAAAVVAPPVDTFWTSVVSVSDGFVTDSTQVCQADRKLSVRLRDPPCGLT